MPYVASKPRCDVLDNPRMLFLYTQEGHLLTFFYYCTVLPGNTGEHWWDSSTIKNISALQSSVSDPLRSQDCKHCSFEDEKLKHSWEQEEQQKAVDWLWLPGLPPISWSLIIIHMSVLGPLSNSGWFIFRISWECTWLGSPALLTGSHLLSHGSSSTLEPGFHKPLASWLALISRPWATSGIQWIGKRLKPGAPSAQPFSRTWSPEPGFHLPMCLAQIYLPNSLKSRERIIFSLLYQWSALLPSK